MTIFIRIILFERTLNQNIATFLRFMVALPILFQDNREIPSNRISGSIGSTVYIS